MTRFKRDIANQIKDELEKIRYYYSYRDILIQASKFCGENEIVERVRLYNSYIVKAHIRLYHIYYELYVCGHSIASLANKLCYSSDYIEQLNVKLINFFKEQIYTNSLM